MSLKYYKQSDVYKNYNGANFVDLNEMRATSYHWWPYLKRIGNLIVFNNYSYSSQTSKHQNDCVHLLRDQGINVDLWLDTATHLDDINGIYNEYRDKIKALIILIRNPRTRKNRERMEQIKDMRVKMHLVKRLIGVAE